VLRSEDRSRLDLDLDRLDGVRARLSRVEGLSQRVAQAFAGAEFAPAEEIDAALYEGFIPRDDRATLTALREGPIADLAAPPPLRDSKSRALLEAYQARWAPETLDPAQRGAWEARLRDRLLNGRDGATPLAEAEARLAALLPEASDPAPLQELAAHYAHLRRRWGL
jgi:exonuclease I